MSVVNCKVKFIRPAYNNLKEWMDDPNNIYVARNGVVFVDKVRYPRISSPFANPYKVGKDGDRETVITKYEDYIIEKIEKNPKLKDQIKEMKGKNLGCWCHPLPCHADVLLRIINEM